MNTHPALTSSKSRFFFLYLLAIAITAILSFALGAEASAAKSKASGGIAATGGTGTTKSDAEDIEYAQIYQGLPTGEKRWARSTSECESGGDPDAIGSSGLYRGAFQFLKSTWKASPKSPGGDPIAYDYKTQAVVAILLKKRDGAGHWPVCG